MISKWNLNKTRRSVAPVPVGGGVVNEDLVGDFEAIYQQLITDNPLLDTLRRWVAPYSGTVTVTGNVALIEDTSEERASYKTADGVRVAIQVNNSERWFTEIAHNDYTAHAPTNVENIAVNKGDVIYFRVQSRFDGSYDQVSWNPRIDYLGVADVRDANNLNVYHYTAAEDFVQSGLYFETHMPFDGVVRLSGTLDKLAATSDNIDVQIVKNGTVIHTQSLSASATGAVTLNQDIPVQKNLFASNGTLTRAADQIRLRVKIDSPIDLKQLNWRETDPPKMTYVSSPDLPDIGNPNVSAVTSFELLRGAP